MPHLLEKIKSTIPLKCIDQKSPLQLHIIAPLPLGLLAIKLDVEDAIGEHFTPIPREEVR